EGLKNSLFVKTDITDTAQVKKAVAAALERYGKIDILVNCAGVAPGAKLLGKKGPHDIDLFRRTIEINLIGPFDVMRLAAEQMVKNTPNADGERGVIVNTASGAAFDGQMGQSAYAASKAAIAGMTLPLARDLMDIGIRVCSVAPGLYNTPMVAGFPEQVRAQLATMIPFPRRLGNPEEFAFLVQHIIENPYLNGETIRIDGALRMAPK
ncbi:MAG TPA: SDR family NAD(P)-dependent oxidoreductase, partial [Smithellaceae bacterium]|nr:SDR family NAD(P)-dependent oxidoreductase [Smithellaceae bacterium]